MEDEIKRHKRKYHKELARHKASRHGFFFVVLLFIACFAGLIYWQIKTHVYNGYSIEKETPFSVSLNAHIMRVGDSILTYSRDGAHMSGIDGESNWNVTYAIQELMVRKTGETIAIAGFNDSNILVANTEKHLSNISTAMPIKNMTVSESGYITAVISNNEETFINTYSDAGTLLFSGKSHIETSGYPMALALSPDAQNLAVSYLSMEGDEIKSQMIFYNFGAMGTNKTDYIVSDYTYTDIIVPEIVFLNNETSVAVGDSRIMFYTGALMPTLYKEYLFEREVCGVFTNDEKIGVVFVSDEANYSYMIDVYNASAEKLGRYYFDMDFEDIFFERDAFVIYNHKECEIFAYNGLVKFNEEFRNQIQMMLPTNRAYKYVLVTGDKIQTVQLN